MCGRYAAFRSLDEIRRIFGTVNPLPDFAPTWNMAPTRLAPVVRVHPHSNERHLDLLRWGLVAHWARDPKSIRQPINARAETAATAPMFRDAFAHRRCIVPVDAFYEWQITGGARRPHAIARADGTPMALAGLWEGWRGPDGEVLRSFTVVTTAASPVLRALHERMPVVLEPPDWPLWLGERPGEDAGEIAALLCASAAAFRVWPVSTLVNSVRNDGAHLLDPAPSLV